MDVGESWQGEWLVKDADTVRGPFSLDELQQRAERGELGQEAQVAWSGTGDGDGDGDAATFYPVLAVAGLAQVVVENAQRQSDVIRRKWRGRVWTSAAASALSLAIATVAVSAHASLVRVTNERTARAQQIESALWERLWQTRPALTPVRLAPEPEPPPPPKTVITARPKKQRPEPCRLGSSDMASGLKQASRELVVCVQDARKKDSAGLLPASLPIRFVVHPDGKVSEFGIDDPNFASGPLKNCMTKVLWATAFPKSNGGDCPFDTKLKIGR